jgi:hypothetical protein
MVAYILEHQAPIYNSRIPRTLFYHLTQTFQPLDEAARHHPACLNHLAVFAVLYTISVSNASIQRRILIHVDATQPRAD